VDKVKIPLIAQEADDYSTWSGQPLQALSCHLFDIIYWFKFLIKDQNGSELVVNCKDESAVCIFTPKLKFNWVKRFTVKFCEWNYTSRNTQGFFERGRRAQKIE